MTALDLTHITVKRDRLVLEVTVSNPALRMTTPDLARRACQLRPRLAEHACVNEAGSIFGTVIAHTSLPHLLEHMIIDLQTQQEGDHEALFVGASEWVDFACGRARVEVSFESDVAGMAAVGKAVAVINDLLSEAEADTSAVKKDSETL